MKLKYIIGLFCVVVLCSCKEKELKPVEQIVDFGYDYYPVEVGFWQEYDVSQTIWNDFDHSVQYLNYQWREVIESQFVSSNGDTLYRLECYQRANESEQWAIQRVYFLRKDSKMIERQEENLVFCKMYFPLQENTTWNEYLYIDSSVFYSTHYFNTNVIYWGVKSNDAKVEFYKIPKDINGQHFEDCIGIDLHSYQTTINEDTEKEYYAKGAGMVYQYVNHTEKTAIEGSFVINKGYILEKKIADYKR